MANILGHAVIGCGLAGALVVGAVAPSSAQGVYANPYYYSAPQGYAGYNGYAYSPGYVARSWDYPAGYDTSGMAHSYRVSAGGPTAPSVIPPSARRTAASARHALSLQI